METVYTNLLRETKTKVCLVSQRPNYIDIQMEKWYLVPQNTRNSYWDCVFTKALALF